MLARRVHKTFRRLHPRMEASGVGAFRLYDRDIPEVRAVVDWYEGHLVVGEYARRQTEAAGDWLGVVAAAVADVLGVPPARVHTRRRWTGRQRTGVGPEPERAAEVEVREHELRFLVRLDGYLDVGLFPDQRLARQALRAEARGLTVLNLFAYTGSFSVAALAGGARHVTSVDLSKPYLAWSQANLRLNGLPLERHEPARADAFAFLAKAARHGRRWDRVIVDPPSRSTAGGPTGRGFDVQRDHPSLLAATLDVVAPGGAVWFSTNHQRFRPRLEGRLAAAEETTERTVPQDFRNRTVHRSWRIDVGRASPPLAPTD